MARQTITLPLSAYTSTSGAEGTSRGWTFTSATAPALISALADGLTSGVLRSIVVASSGILDIDGGFSDSLLSIGAWSITIGSRTFYDPFNGSGLSSGHTNLYNALSSATAATITFDNASVAFPSLGVTFSGVTGTALTGTIPEATGLGPITYIISGAPQPPVGITLSGRTFSGVPLAKTDYANHFVLTVQATDATLRRANINVTFSIRDPANTQTIVLLERWFTDTSTLVRWQRPGGSTYRPQINAQFVESGTERYLHNVVFREDGSVLFAVEESQTSASGVGDDVSEAFESGGQITAFAAGESVTYELSELGDTDEPYSGTPSNSADVAAFATALDGSSDLPGVLRLYLPPTVSSHQVDADGVDLDFEVSKPTVTYTDGVFPTITRVEVTSGIPGSDLFIYFSEPVTGRLPFSLFRNGDAVVELDAVQTAENAFVTSFQYFFSGSYSSTDTFTLTTGVGNTNPLRDRGGNNFAAILNRAVTNSSSLHYVDASGVELEFEASKAVGIIPDTTAPVVVGNLGTDGRGTIVVITLSELATLGTTEPEDFTVTTSSSTALTPTLVDLVTGGPRPSEFYSIIRLSFNRPITRGEDLNISYTAREGGISDLSGNPLASFSATILSAFTPIVHIDANPVELDFETSRPGITKTGATTEHDIDAEGVNLDFEASKPVVTYTDRTAPTLISAEVYGAGSRTTHNSIRLILSEGVTSGPSGWAVQRSPGTSPLEIGSVSPLTRFSVLDLHAVIENQRDQFVRPQIVTLSYDSSVGNAQDLAGNPLPSFTNFPVRNNSDDVELDANPVELNFETSKPTTSVTYSIDAKAVELKFEASKPVISKFALNLITAGPTEQLDLPFSDSEDRNDPYDWTASGAASALIRAFFPRIIDSQKVVLIIDDENGNSQEIPLSIPLNLDTDTQKLWLWTINGPRIDDVLIAGDDPGYLQSVAISAGGTVIINVGRTATITGTADRRDFTNRVERFGTLSFRIPGVSTVELDFEVSKAEITHRGNHVADANGVDLDFEVSKPTPKVTFNTNAKGVDLEFQTSRPSVRHGNIIDESAEGVTLDFEVAVPTTTTTFRSDAEGINLALEASKPTIFHRGNFTANAEGVTLEFETSRAVPFHMGVHAADAEGVNLVLQTSRPTVLHRGNFKVDARGVVLDFETSRPIVSATVHPRELIELTQKFDPGDALVELYILEYEGESYYLQGMTSEVIQYASPDGTTHDYMGVPVKMDGLEHKSDGASVRPTLTVANTIFNAIDLQAEEFIGARITRRQTLKKLLVQNPPVEFPIQKYIVDRVAGSNVATTEFELAAPFDLARLTLPKRQIIGHLCPWEYQGVDRFGRGGCTWPKDSTTFYDKDDKKIEPYHATNNPTGYVIYNASSTYSNRDKVRFTTTDGALTIYESVANNNTEIPGPSTTQWIRIDLCGKRLASCKARFNPITNSSSVPLPFGAFPGSRKFR